jgi:hypothetical protein
MSDARTPALRSRSTWAAAVACALGVVAGITCGGTTGREGLEGPPPGVDAGAPSDDSSADPGAFDVSVTYVDRVLPDVVPPPTGDAAAGYPWPSCPAFLPVGPDGGEVPLGGELNQIPSVYDDDGGVLPAPDGSACATYAWLGNKAVDGCLTSSASGWGQGDFALLPPCSWCADAGTASQGPGAGSPMYSLCLTLYACAMRTGCGAGQDPATCLCGNESASDCIVDAGGPCAVEELAALEYRGSSVQEALSNYTQIDPSFLGYCGSALNYVFQSARTNGCFVPDAGAN